MHKINEINKHTIRYDIPVIVIRYILLLRCDVLVCLKKYNI
jgi:hypothetical protein